MTTLSVPKLVESLIQADQDHEFYPTTNEIIAALARNIGLTEDLAGRRQRTHTFTSLLDVGAGNGKVLTALRDKCGFTELFAIEKASLLCQQLPPEVLVIGTEFHEQSLMSKPVDVVYCNPPYKDFENWSARLIRECAATVLFLCIPQRWQKSTVIADALQYRETSPVIVGEFSFADAEDRTARAKVHLLRIGLAHSGDKDDAFDRWFNTQFADVINKFKPTEAPRCADCHTELTEANKRGKKLDEYLCPNCYRRTDVNDAHKGGRTRPFHSLVVGPDYPNALVSLYDAEMAHIQKNYQALGQLDVDLMREFEIFPSKVLAGLKQRMKGLKNDYWMELFSNLDTITNRLTSSSRKELLNTLHKHVSVDFTVSNIVEIVLWVIKNANQYIDRQLITTYERMVEKANVRNYKSNQRVFTENDWRYLRGWDRSATQKPFTHYGLDYRIVLQCLGGCRPHYGTIELAESAAEFMGDIMTIAANLGFQTPADERYAQLSYQARREWRPGEKVEFFFNRRKTGTREMLFDVRAFQNGNCHFRFNQEFMLALNVEHGRLKGWLRTPQEAVEQLDDPKAARYFATNLLLTAGNSTLLLGPPEPEPEPEPEAEPEPAIPYATLRTPQSDLFSLAV